MRTWVLTAGAALGGGTIGSGIALLAGRVGGGPLESGGWAGTVGLASALGAAAAVAFLTERRVARPLRALASDLRSPAAPEPAAGSGPRGTAEVEELLAAADRVRETGSRALEAEASERARLLGVLERMPVGLLGVDGRGRVELVNEAAREIIGQRDEVRGRPLIEAMRSGELQGAVDTVLAEGREVTLEFGFSDSGRRRVSAQVFPVGEGAVAVLQDVTRVRRLEEARREMAANIGHELRTPLAAILGYLETLEHSPDLSADERDRFLGIIGRNARRLESLVKDLSRLTRLESGVLPPEREALELASLVAATLEALGPRAGAKGLRMRSEFPTSLPRLWADRDGLETVLLNLLDNAVRATPPGGEIVVGAAREEALVRVWVEDTGPGVPRELRDRVFERFYRLDPGRSADEGGSGLGLAIVKHTLLRQGGDVGLEEGSRGGARFWFRLPIAPGQSPEPQS